MSSFGKGRRSWPPLGLSGPAFGQPKADAGSGPTSGAASANDAGSGPTTGANPNTNIVEGINGVQTGRGATALARIPF
jgi:hypothetical protein